MTIQQIIDKITKEVWVNIELAHRLNTKYGEETISDIFLLELARQKNYNLRIIQTPKNIEPLQGTDWEWYIGSQLYGWIRFAIQAKKIKLNTLNGDYGLNYYVGSQRQIDNLKKYANANNAIPLYCFYNNYANANEKEHWHCNLKYEKELLGWTITPVKNVENALAHRGSKNFKFIHSQKETLTVKCLFECPLFMDLYKDEKTIDKKINIMGVDVIKIKTLPYNLIDQRDIINIQSFPEQLYNPDIRIYPKRIAIFDITE